MPERSRQIGKLFLDASLAIAFIAAKRRCKLTRFVAVSTFVAFLLSN